jgi:tRNA pseudouridine38-40 synthase
MNAAAKELLGRHDFSAFIASGAEGNRVRTMYRAEVRREGDLVTVELEASGFMQQMARAIVGTLMLVGRGKLTSEDVRDIMRSRDRSRAGETAPAAGLYLVEVRYAGGNHDAELGSPKPGDEDEENE